MKTSRWKLDRKGDRGLLKAKRSFVREMERLKIRNPNGKPPEIIGSVPVREGEWLRWWNYITLRPHLHKFPPLDRRDIFEESRKRIKNRS